MATQFDYYLISGLSMLFTGHYMSLTSEPYVQCLHYMQGLSLFQFDIRIDTIFLAARQYDIRLFRFMFNLISFGTAIRNRPSMWQIHFRYTAHIQNDLDFF